MRVSAPVSALGADSRRLSSWPPPASRPARPSKTVADAGPLAVRATTRQMLRARLDRTRLARALRHDPRAAPAAPHPPGFTPGLQPQDTIAAAKTVRPVLGRGGIGDPFAIDQEHVLVGALLERHGGHEGALAIGVLEHGRFGLPGVEVAGQ